MQLQKVTCEGDTSIGQVPPKFFLGSAPYGASPSADVVNPVQPGATNPQQSLLPPNFTDPGTTIQGQAGPTQQSAFRRPNFGGGMPFGQDGDMQRLFGRGLF